jgi:hypothetical protein
MSLSKGASPIYGLNIRRIILGGFAAGLVSNGFDFVITQIFMANEFASILTRLNVDEAAAQAWIPLFALADFVWGFLLVFTYAAIRPRFGPGPKTAIIGATMIWLALAISVLILVAIGLHTPQSYLKSAALYLISAITSSLVGAALYRENA